jgi:hypothetical protein
MATDALRRKGIQAEPDVHAALAILVSEKEKKLAIKGHARTVSMSEVMRDVLMKTNPELFPKEGKK